MYRLIIEYTLTVANSKNKTEQNKNPQNKKQTQPTNQRKKPWGSFSETFSLVISLSFCLPEKIFISMLLLKEREFLWVYNSRIIAGFSFIIFEDIILSLSGFYHCSKISCHYTCHYFLGKLSLFGFGIYQFHYDGIWVYFFLYEKGKHLDIYLFSTWLLELSLILENPKQLSLQIVPFILLLHAFLLYLTFSLSTFLILSFEFFKIFF